MAARNPPLYLQAGSHPATNDRLLLEALMAPPPAVVSGAGYGIVAPSDLAVTQNGTPNMTVNVAAGKAFVDGTENANQGAYLCVNDGTVNLAVAASNPTNPRKDLVVAKVQDAEWSGATNLWSLAVVTGTAAASPAEPAVPANAFVLAMIDVAANATSITNANITDRRRRASALGGVVTCTSTTRPASPYSGQQVWETDTNRLSVWDGSAWYPLSNGPTCRAYHNTTQSLTNGVETTIALNSERFDTDTMHDLVTNNSRITFKTAGVYDLKACLEVANATDYTFIFAAIRLNGTTQIDAAGGQVADAADWIPILKLATTYQFAANDYVEIRMQQNNVAAASRNVTVNGNRSPEFSASWIGRG